jgi:DNA-binding transcriptional regulator YiaG
MNKDEAALVTPIFDNAMAQRLEIIREKHLMTQGMLSKDLGVSQSTLSQLEQGKLPVARRPFSMLRLIEVFGADDAKFILDGTNFHRYDAKRIHHKYILETYRKCGPGLKPATAPRRRPQW